MNAEHLNSDVLPPGPCEDREGNLSAVSNHYYVELISDLANVRNASAIHVTSERCVFNTVREGSTRHNEYK